MNNFRRALAALVPSFEAVSIPWRDEWEHYDDFDEIAKTLFKNLVLSTVAYSTQDFDLLRSLNYGMLAKNPWPRSFIAVHNGNKEIVGQFHKFLTSREPFDSVVALRIRGQADYDEKDRLVLKANDVTYSFMHIGESGATKKLEQFTV